MSNYNLESEASSSPLRPDFSVLCPPRAIDMIKNTYEELARQLKEGEQLSLRLKRRRSTGHTSQSTRKTNETRGVVTISFPGRSAAEAWRFTVVLRILEIIYGALKRDAILTKREIYYQDPALFGTQLVVDRYIEDIALTLDLPRHWLNIRAASKGLVRGPYSATTIWGAALHAMSARDGTIIPDLAAVTNERLWDILWIVVIEKETTFRTIISSIRTGGTLNDGLFITAKGYPDVMTRQFIRHIQNEQVQHGVDITILGLVDWDPDGFSILSNYKYGSQRPTVSMENLCLPEMQLVGLRSDRSLFSETVEVSQTLTMRDRKKATSMLRTDPIAREPDIRSELQRMLMFNVKIELEQFEMQYPMGMVRALRVLLA